MKEIAIRPYVRYLSGVAFATFILNKLYIRAWVIENELPTPFQIIVFSIPNLIEAVIGMLVLTAILLQLRQVFNKDDKIKESTIYLIALIISALYVIPQELKIHNLGGRNVYDPYDLIASIIGLLFRAHCSG